MSTLEDLVSEIIAWVGRIHDSDEGTRDQARHSRSAQGLLESNRLNSVAVTIHLPSFGSPFFMSNSVRPVASTLSGTIEVPIVLSNAPRGCTRFDSLNNEGTRYNPLLGGISSHSTLDPSSLPVTSHPPTYNDALRPLNNPPLFPDRRGFSLPNGDGLDTSSDMAPLSLHIKGVSLLESEPICGTGLIDVYRGKWDGHPVALKRLRVFQNHRDNHKLIIDEALKWRNLNHPNVVLFLGIEYKTFAPLVCLVTPWMHITVKDAISNQGPSTINVSKLLHEIAEGLAYLHSMEIVHGDLRADNVLIKDDGHPCLANFGLNALADAISGAKASIHHDSPRWMAPELLDPEAFGLIFRRTKASDVYAFACVCYEVFSGLVPFADETNDIRVLLRVLDGNRPQRPPMGSGIPMSNNMWILVESSWAQQPSERPNMNIAAATLEG